ncbi:hypothetical protein D3C75_798360 [compost metagenome]
MLDISHSGTLVTCPFGRIIQPIEPCNFHNLTHLGGRSFVEMLAGSKKANLEPVKPSKNGVWERSNASSHNRS